MRYKTYIINCDNASNIRCGTDGYQPKFLVENGRKFLKVQCQIGRTLRDDWRVEDIASRICDTLNIYHVKQTPCKVKIKTNKGVVLDRLGVVSDNFERQGLQFISYSRILERNNINPKYKGYINLNTIDKIKYQVGIMSKLCKIDSRLLLKYMFDIATIDMLVLNQDRHFKNFGVFWNVKMNRYGVAAVFDNGMGLFENDIMFDNMDKLEDCMRYSYIAPYGEDPFELLGILKETQAYRGYLGNLDIKRLNISRSLFVHQASYEYFCKIKKLMKV